MAIRKTSTSGLSNRAIYIDASAATSKIADIPDAPIIGTATAGAESATITYTVANTGGIGTTFTALSNPGSITGTGSSPITVSGLTGEVSYTFTVRSGNTTGNSPYSSASNSVTPTALPTGSYESIATVTGTTGTISFTSIPSTYKHLQIRMSAIGSTAADVYIRFNSDSATNYFCHQMRGGGSVAQAYAYTTQNQMVITSNIGTSSTYASAAVCDILDYGNTNKNKTIRSLTGYDTNGGGEAIFWSGAWNSTSAVTRIDLTMSTGTFNSTSHFALYGIKG
jgi:hypothetical protein